MKRGSDACDSPTGHLCLFTLMRLLLINYEYPPLGGGGGNATMYLGWEFAQRGHRVATLTSAFPGLARHETSRGVAIRRVPSLRRRLDTSSPAELLAFAASSTVTATGLTRDFQPDAVLAFFGFPGGPAAWWLHQTAGIPYVLSLRGSDVPRPEIAQRRLLERVLLPVLRRIWRDAAALTAVSESLRQAAIVCGAPPCIRVIPNGVDCEHFHPDVGVKEPGLRLLYVGRLQPFKGVQHLVRALPQVRAAVGSNLMLEIVGDGPLRGPLTTLVERLALSDCVCFRGWQRKEDMPQVYQQAHLLVLPSYVEGMPNVVLEAMASGLPVVATDVPGTREVVQDGVQGLLVPPRDEAALARAIVALADTQRRSDLGQKARQRALEFSWARVAEEYLKVLAEAAK